MSYIWLCINVAKYWFSGTLLLLVIAIFQVDNIDGCNGPLPGVLGKFYRRLSVNWEQCEYKKKTIFND